ncbi:MAG: GGDEF domain-containing phosphodiesterase, partial [Candidatus Nitrotoga sp.]
RSIIRGFMRFPHEAKKSGNIVDGEQSIYLIRGKDIHTTACIGISRFPEDGRDVDSLLKSTESAMSLAKSRGRNQYQFFNADMQVSEAEYYLYESGLRTALIRDEFFIHYQPQIDTMTGHVVAMEALVRWMHPEQGVLQPGKFIHIAEETGLILPMGNWVLRSACQQLKSWHDAGLVNIQRIAVNLSTLQFHQPDLPALIESALKEVGLEARFLELEITESVAMINPKKTIETLKTLKSMGVALAIDDFGTWHSSLNYLKLFPFDCLKIDRSFVQDIESDTHDAAICTATIALANKLGLDVVAEGVETEGQFAFLKNLNCCRIQGYFFSKPLSPEDAYSFALTDNHR